MQNFNMQLMKERSSFDDLDPLSRQQMKKGKRALRKRVERGKAFESWLLRFHPEVAALKGIKAMEVR